jgi:hypothetical protein
MVRKRCSCFSFQRLVLSIIVVLTLGQLMNALFFHWRAPSGDGLVTVDTQTRTRTSQQTPLKDRSRTIKFYILPLPEITTWLLGNYTNDASSFYESTLNEHQAEIWLHRAYDRMSHEQGRTHVISEADVVLIPGYLHFNEFMMKASGKQPKKKRKKQQTVQKTEVGVPKVGVPYSIGEFIHIVVSRITDKSKPHVLMVPTWNPGTSRKVGVAPLMNLLQAADVNMWSLGFERNTFWQHVEPERIIPIPYVVEPNVTSVQQLAETIGLPRRENFVFYSGDARKNAFGWSGCNRSMVSPLANRTDMHVRIVTKDTNRLSQDEYSHQMHQSDYCLLLCGDTPTSRSLASSMLYGCIPVRVGSRLRGLCDSPCRPGWGWTVAGANHSHMPFADTIIDWDAFPELNEADFAERPAAVLEEMFARIGPEKKTELRAIMSQTQRGWLYGLGNPVNSTDFGDAALYILESIVQGVSLSNNLL